MVKSESLGMQTFDNALYRLYQAGKIDLGESAHNTDSPNNLRVKVNLNSDEPVERKSSANLSLMEKEESSEEEEAMAAAGQQ